MAFDTQQLIGAVVDRRYRIDSRIARGGMSTVYRALDLRLDRPVALKLMDPQFAHDPKFLARFEMEARSVARLRHPGLVSVYDQGQDGDLVFLVMELVDGGTLRDLLRERGPMPPHAVRAVAEPVLAALGAAHAAGLVHRDIKPENVLISSSGEIKLVDFGLVRAVAEASATSQSVILGTAAYLSPEQVLNGFADARSDVYAMGVLVFELLTGGTPFIGDTPISVAYQRLERDVPSPARYIDGVPEELAEFVATATARDPQERFPDANAMGTDLREIAVELALPAYRVPAPRPAALPSPAPPAASGHHAAGPRASAPAGNAAADAAHTSDFGADAATTHIPAVSAPRLGQSAGPHPTRVVTAPTRRGIAEPERAPEHDQVDSRHRHPEYVDGRRRSRTALWIWLSIVVLLALLLGVVGWWFGSGRNVAIPSTAGQSQIGATTMLNNAGFTTVVKPEYSDTAAASVLIGTDPPAGTRVAPHSTVTLRVSRGQPIVPRFTPGDSVADVQRSLSDASLAAVDGGEAYDKVAPVGSVVSLSPAPGTTVPVGSQVKVERSKGPPPAPVPDLHGQTEAQARATLEGLGLKVGDSQVSFDASTDGGSVIKSDPPAGTPLPAGSQVTLYVSNAVTVPDLVPGTVKGAEDTLAARGLLVLVRGIFTGHSSLLFSQSPSPGTRVEPGSTVTVNTLI